MSRKTYRICLILLIVAGMVGGIVFYSIDDRKEPMLEKGVFVKHIENMIQTEEVWGAVV